MAFTKRFLRAFLLTAIAAVFVIGVLPYTAYAAGPDIFVDVRSTGISGEYEAVVSIANNPGISVYNLALGFDNTKLTPVSITQGSVLTGGMVFASNLIQAVTDEEKALLNEVTAVWGAAEDKHGDGTLFTVAFRAKPSSEGNTAVTLSVNRVIGGIPDTSGNATPSPSANNNSGFGHVPQTGVTDIYVVAAVLAVCFAVSAVLWCYILRRKRDF